MRWGFYYYTTQREDGDVDSPHFTLYKNAEASGEAAHGEPAPTISRKPEASAFAMGLGRDYRIGRLEKRTDNSV